jgi:hypothetical protein
MLSIIFCLTEQGEAEAEALRVEEISQVLMVPFPSLTTTFRLLSLQASLLFNIWQVRT